MNNLITSTKFNSKLYAQKTLKNMIDDSKSTMGDVYSTNQINIAVDTSDLIKFANSKTQYKESHYVGEDDGVALIKNTDVSLKIEEKEI